MVADFIDIPENYEFPEWLEEYRICDKTLQDAYNMLPSSYRACIKTGLSLTHFLFNQPAIKEKCEIKAPHAGFWQKKSQRPALWTIIVFGENYKAAARLCSAAAMPVLSDVANICAICLGGSPFTNLLPVLELCGIENIFSMEPSVFSSLLQDLISRNLMGYGRIILLHNGELSLAGNLIRELAIPCYEEFKEPNLVLLSPDKFSRELLVFAQGFYPSTENFGIVDAVYCESPDSEIFAPLYITPGLEGLWINQGLTQGFFKLSSSSFGLI